MKHTITRPILVMVLFIMFISETAWGRMSNDPGLLSDIYENPGRYIAYGSYGSGAW